MAVKQTKQDAKKRVFMTAEIKFHRISKSLLVKYNCFVVFATPVSVSL
jgi:hypothetical protein